VDIKTSIESKLSSALQPEFLQIENESHMHGGPATESHFKLTVVSNKFDNLMLIKRHREIYRLLADELAGDVHALALHTYTPSEWQHNWW
jgi:BolA protein